MPPERYPPDDPREWLNRARSNLSRAKARIPEAYLEDLCFDAQQAAEKAIKALLIKRGVAFPYVHDLAHLLTLLEEAGEAVPISMRQAFEALSHPDPAGPRMPRQVPCLPCLPVGTATGRSVGPGFPRIPAPDPQLFPTEGALD